MRDGLMGEKGKELVEEVAFACFGLPHDRNDRALRVEGQFLQCLKRFLVDPVAKRV